MSKIIRKIFNSRVLSNLVFLTFLVSAIYVVTAITLAPTTATSTDTHRVKGDYVLMLFQCILGIFAMLLPGILRKRLHISMPSKMIVMYALFLYCAIYLGEVREFYYRIPQWDAILHTFSGAMLGALGFSFINFLNKTDKVPLSLSPLFVAVFTFCFAVTLGVVWEIYELGMDTFLHTNMQKFALENGEPLVGQAALMDTMQDLMVDSIGACVMSVVGFISLKYKKGWIEKFQLKMNQ